MPTSEDESIERALQTEGSIDKLSDLGLLPEDLDGLTVLDLGAGHSSSLQRSLSILSVNTNLILVDAKPRWGSGINVGKFSQIPISKNKVDLLISRNACPMYIPVDNPDLAIKVIGEIKRVLKPGGEARLAPWELSKVDKNKRGIPDGVLEKDAPEIFAAMRSVSGLTFQLIDRGDIDPKREEVRRD